MLDSFASPLRATSHATAAADTVVATLVPPAGTYFSALSCTSCALLYLSASLPSAGRTMDCDLSSEIFAHCMPSGAQLLSTFQEEGTLPQKRQRPEQGRPHGRMPGRMHQHRPAFSTYSAHHPQSPPPFGTPPSQRENHIRLLSKIVLKQEEQLALLRKDTQFVLFMRQDDKSLLPEQGRESLKTADWLRNDTAWTYLRWAPKQKRLVVDESREPLLHDEAVPVLSALQKAITGDIVTKFNSTVNLARLEEEGSQQAVFHLAVSLRGSGATEVHEQLCKLVGSSLTHLAAFSMKKDDLLRPPQVKQLAQLTYGGGPPCPRRLAHLQLHPPATIGPQTLLSPGLPCIIPRTIAT